MKKKYLGIIYLIYAIIIAYVYLNKYLNNYLAPQLQIYIKISFIPLIIIGLIMCFNRRVEYKFKISDLILLIPIILLIISGDGKLSLGLAENRATNLFNQAAREARQKREEEKTDDQKEEIQQIDITNIKYDFTNPDFLVIDENYEALADYLTYSEKALSYIGKTIKVKGFTIKYASYLPNGYFALGKYVISCCAADASFSGFIVKYDFDKIRHNKWYEIEGVLVNAKSKEGYDILAIQVINIKELDGDSENQYVYPCYAYDNGLCKEVSKYNLDY